MRKADLNDLRKCSDICSKIIEELNPEQSKYNILLQEWAVWASYAANHPKSELQDLRNAACIYYSLKDFEKAIKFRERAAEHNEAELMDYINLALTFRFAQKHKEAHYWYKKILNHEDTIFYPKMIEAFTRNYNNIH